MATNKQLPQLLLFKPSLADLQPVALPAGYALRQFRDGDEASWNGLLDGAFDRPPGTTQFDREMRVDPEFRPERVLLIETAGSIVATASAWFEAKYGPRCGQVHWVATSPSHRGKKLGYWASLATLWQMHREGRTHAVLRTDDFRLPALRIYLEMGFRPALNHENQRERWRNILDNLKWPERFEDVLAGALETFPKDA